MIEPLPFTRQVLRWCEDCQLMTWSIMLDGHELCERWDSHDEADDDWDCIEICEDE